MLVYYCYFFNFIQNMFAVVELKTKYGHLELAIVPECWLVNESQTRWPPSRWNVTKLVKNLTKPTNKWSTLDCLIRKRNIGIFRIFYFI